MSSLPRRADRVPALLAMSGLLVLLLYACGSAPPRSAPPPSTTALRIDVDVDQYGALQLASSDPAVDPRNIVASVQTPRLIHWVSRTGGPLTIQFKQANPSACTHGRKRLSAPAGDPIACTTLGRAGDYGYTIGVVKGSEVYVEDPIIIVYDE